jgi:hypothetical protein
MANTIDNTLKKIGNTIESIMGGTKIQQPSSNVSTSGKQTCLEKFGIEARKEHLYRNDWKIDLQYTKALVDAEYMIQNEFPVGNTNQSVQDQMEAAKKKEEKANKTKLDKLREKRDKLNTKIETLEGKSKTESIQ